MAEPFEFDVAIIGAGVVGAAIARELSGYQLRIALVESGSDVGCGTSKANTAILHTGFDAPPGSLEARLVRRGWEMLKAYGPKVGIPIEDTGALLVAWSAEELAEFGSIVEKAAANGYSEIRALTIEEIYQREPHLGAGALGGLAVPGEGIICTFTTPLAFATEAVENGTELFLGSALTNVARSPDGEHLLELDSGDMIRTHWVINAAGLNSDVIDRWFGHQRFTITPRRGQLIVFDKLARRLVNHIVLPIPTKMGKGVLVAPTVYGNVLLGPTAEVLSDRAATQSTEEGLEGLLAKGQKLLPALLQEEVTGIYAGLRASSEHSDYQIFADTDARFVTVGGIRSTGLTASMAIGEYVLGLLGGSGLSLRHKADHRPIHMPNIGEAFLRPYMDEPAVAADPEYGRIVCYCERVSLGEIRDAANALIPAYDLDGLRRRTRAHMGRCQGFYCSARVHQLLADSQGQSLDAFLAAPPRTPRRIVARR